MEIGGLPSIGWEMAGLNLILIISEACTLVQGGGMVMNSESP